MTPAELVKQFRREVDDRVAPYLWSEGDVYHYLDVAQREMARSTLYFPDSTTADVCQATVIADEEWVELSPLIVEIRRAKLSSQRQPLKITTLDKAEQSFLSDDYGAFAGGAGWDDRTGTPRALITDMEIDKGRLVPIPTEADTLEMSVYRLPLNTVTTASTELEITDARHQRHLLLGMKALAYDVHDADVRNEVLALDYRARFEAACREVKWELLRRRDKQWTTRSAWV